MRNASRKMCSHIFFPRHFQFPFSIRNFWRIFFHPFWGGKERDSPVSAFRIHSTGCSSWTRREVWRFKITLSLFRSLSGSLSHDMKTGGVCGVVWEVRVRLCVCEREKERETQIGPKVDGPQSALVLNHRRRRKREKCSKVFFQSGRSRVQAETQSISFFRKI